MKYPLFLSDFIQTLILSKGFRKNPKNIKKHINMFCGTKLFHADRHTDGRTDRHTRRS